MTIRYALPHAGPAQLEVFGAAGERVRTLVQGTLTAGPHFAIWDGRGESGARLPSGTYFVRLRMDGQSNSVKVMLVR